jgi:thiosulfate dehydrogenase [quinone] large subunit
MDMLSRKPGTGNTGRWTTLPAWIILPLRLFLGITFIYAGLQKIFDPNFFNDASHGSIKYQLEIFSHSSPLRLLLVNVAIPHADLFGWLVALGELWVGIATLIGLFTRLSALGGMFISLLLWLTATWSVSPYFLGSDSIYAMAWLTLALVGISDFSVDQWLASRQQRDQDVLVNRQRRYRLSPERQATLNHYSRLATDYLNRASHRLNGATEAVLPALEQPADIKRRALLRSLLAGGTVFVAGNISAMLVHAVEPVAVQLIADLRRLRGHRGGDNAGDNGNAPGSPSNLPSSAAGPVGNISQLPVNSALAFTLASTGDPGLVIRLTQKELVAYDATCTHQGCTVNYDPSTQALICPCHGAAYDASNHAAVLAGPTSLPLTSVPVSIDASGNIHVEG